MKYGLIGEKLGHSFSKEIHRCFGDYEYELCEVAKGELDRFMRDRDFCGINVTIPYKEAVIPYLDWIDESAKEIGAINAVVNCEGRLYGYNTDFFGMIALFEHAGIDVKDRKAAILGSGGTSKTAEVVLRSLGAAEILKVSRSGKGGAITYEELYDKHSDAEIIVNTTPVGMFPNIFDCPIDLTRFDRLSGLIDAVYNPINTTLVQRAMAMGIKAEGGLYMLVAQAAQASELFLNENGNASPYSLNKAFEDIRSKKQNIVLVGMPASGKSTVGKILADRLGREFIDTDELIESKTGMAIKDFFAMWGEGRFREIESEVIREVSAKTSMVISTGGGAILDSRNISALKYNGKICFIDRPLQDLVPTDTRPLSSDRESIEKRYNERYSIYCSCSDLHIDANCDADAVAEKILENLK